MVAFKSFKKSYNVFIDGKEGFLDITPQIEEAIRESEVKEGFAVVYNMHTSSAIFITDSDRELVLDIMDALREAIPDLAYRHDEVDYKKNALGHIKSALLGVSILLPITDGKWDRGHYHRVYYVDFDAGREKSYFVKVVGSIEG